MKLDRRTLIAGSVGLAAGGAIAALVLGRKDKVGRRREGATADVPATGDQRDLAPEDLDLDRLQWTSVLYYLHETNPDNGLVRDKTDPTAPSSIAAVGMALATLPVVVERGTLFREFAAKLARRRLKFLYELPQGPEPDVSGYKGFFYHFLDIETGRRAGQCELSTIDSAFLFAGMLTAATYFDQETADETEVRRLAELLYRRAEWDWARNGGSTVTQGWLPETGFLPIRYEGYDEGLLLYILGLGSPTHPLPPRATLPSAQPTSGSSYTVASCSTPARCLPTNSRTCGSTSAVFATPSCATTAPTTSKTAVRRPSCSRRTRFKTRCSSSATEKTAGGLRPATAPAG